MDKTRLWIIGSVLAMIVLAAGGWVVGVQPQLDAAAAADAESAHVDATNEANRAVLARLQKDAQELPALKGTLAALGTSVPSVPDLPGFQEEVNGYAAASGVTVTSWQVSDAQAYTPPAAPVTASVAPGSPAGSSTATAAPTATPAPTGTPTPGPTPTAIPGAPPPANPLVTAENFTVIPVSVTVRGDYAKIVAFAAAAQAAKRLFLVTGFSVDPAADAPGYDGKVSGYIYVLTAPKDAAKGSK
jgi:Tfp pilus assembly protein PilO